MHYKRKAMVGTQVNLKELIEALSGIDERLKLRFDFPHMSMSGVCSYRGYYDELAVEPLYDVAHDDLVLVRDFLALLKKAASGTLVFDGWKGGRYTMTLDTPVWVSRYGYASDMVVTGAATDGYYAYLTTSVVDEP